MFGKMGLEAFQGKLTKRLGTFYCLSFIHLSIYTMFINVRIKFYPFKTFCVVIPMLIMINLGTPLIINKNYPFCSCKLLLVENFGHCYPTQFNKKYPKFLINMIITLNTRNLVQIGKVLGYFQRL